MNLHRADFIRDVVLKHGADECFFWPFARNSSGYGHAWFDGSLQYVHRIACIEENGPPPTSDHTAAHSCGNGHKGCCARRHIRWATHAENMGDAVNHGTTLRGRHPRAKLTEAQVVEILALRGTGSHRAIADRYAVSRELITRILSGKAWPWLMRRAA